MRLSEQLVDHRFRPAMARTRPAPAASAEAPASPRHWGAPLVVWTLWALMVLGGVGFVRSFGGSNVPLRDEWGAMIPVLTGESPLTPAWLWARWNDHRLPLPKLALLAGYWCTDNSFHTAKYVSVLSLAALTCVLLRAARRWRGRTSYTDAFFPLVLLHWGHYENLLFGFQVQFVFSTLLAGLLLALIVRPPGPTRRTDVIGAGLCLVLLPLCGANGVALVPALAVWFGCWADQCWQSGQPQGKQHARTLLAFAAGALLLVVLYFLDYERTANLSPRGGLGDSVLLSAQFLSLGFGPAAWWLGPIAGFLVGGLSVVGALALVRHGRRQPADRCRVFGLACFLTGLGCLALGLGWGRGEVSPRYVTLAAPLLCGLYFLGEVYRPAARTHWIQGSLCLVSLVALGWNLPEGLAHGRAIRDLTAQLEHDVRQGRPLSWLAQHYSSGDLRISGNELVLANEMRQLHRAGIGIFRYLNEGSAPTQPPDSRSRAARVVDRCREGLSPRLVDAPPSE